MEVMRRTVQTLISKLAPSAPNPTRTAALRELRVLTRKNPDIRSVIADEGAIPLLAELLYSDTAVDQDDAAAILLNVSISCSEALMSTHVIFHALSHALTCHQSSVVHSVSATIYSILIDEEYRPLVGSNKGIVRALIGIVETLGFPEEPLRETLKALLSLALCPPNWARMMELGAPAALFAAVKDERRVGVVEDATAVIAELSGFDKSPTAFRGVSGIRVLVDLLNMDMSWSGRVRENSVHGLLNLVQFGEGDVVDEIREFGCGFVLHGLKMVAKNGSVQGRREAEKLINIIDGVSALRVPSARVRI